MLKNNLPKRIVFLIRDITTIGGIQNRVRKIIKNSSNRSVSYYCLSIDGSEKSKLISETDKIIFCEKNNKKTLEKIASWDPKETVIIFSNNALLNIEPKLRIIIGKFPLIYIGSGQLSFHIQDSNIFTKIEYLKNLRVSKVLLLSELDIITYNQFDCFGQILSFNPVEIEHYNNYDLSKNKFYAYVGRIDFATKGAERLINIAVSLKKLNLGPLKIFTTKNIKNSPNYNDFLIKITENDLIDHIDIILEETDLKKIYNQIKMLILPSKKESFGNVILEAYSFGIPVLSSSYAPGPRQLINHNDTGILTDSYEVSHLVNIFKEVDDNKLLSMSQNAFNTHFSYSLEKYYDHIEEISSSVVDSFDGSNKYTVYPNLRMIEDLSKLSKVLDKREKSKISKYNKYFKFKNYFRYIKNKLV